MTGLVIDCMTQARSQLRCLLGSEPFFLAAFDPNRTLLDFLREERHLTGTKEGCAEGDCGACTILIGELHESVLRYRAVNACILPLGTVDNKQVLTVEHLADPVPHPVQAAMATQHGSQCGFCTPGMVMSLASLHFARADEGCTPTLDQINQALAGNLCRCTGYGPIIDAARAACQQAVPAHCQALREKSQVVLQDWAADGTYLCAHGAAGTFAAPTNTRELRQLIELHPQARLVAGATDVGLWISKRHQRFAAVIHLGSVSELQRIEHSGETLEIGAAVTLADAFAALAALAPDLGVLLRRFGSPQVRGQASIGGNIANGSPISDLAPALIALGARLRLAGPDGEREIALEDFFIDYGHQDLLPGEYVAALSIPADGHQHFRCWKISKRFDQDISAVCGAFNVQLAHGKVHEARIVFGGMAAISRRATRCEAVLKGATPGPALLPRAADALAEDYAPISDLRASAAYRGQAARGLLERYLSAMAGQPVPVLYPAATPPVNTHA